MSINVPTSNESRLFLPLNVGESVLSLIPRIAIVHDVKLDPSLYEDSSVYLTDNGELRVDLVNLHTGLVDYAFTNGKTSVGLVKGETPYFPHPKSGQYPEIEKNLQVVINTKCELRFLNDMTVGTIDDTGNLSSERARHLAQLLNRYQLGDGWSCNPGRGNTTAFFKLLYLGDMKDMPDEFKINHNTPYGAVVELTTPTGPAVYCLAVG